MEAWDERYRSGEFSPPDEPTGVLGRWLEAAPVGRALDVAAGSGRNALFLAERGYEVDAVDVSREGLSIARRRAGERGLNLNLVQADLDQFSFPEERYAVVNVGFYHDLSRFVDLKGALEPGGFLFYEHHLRSSAPLDVGPRDDRHRFGSNELLRNALDLTVLHYEERSYGPDGERGAKASLIARRSGGAAQEYPRLRDG